MSSAARQIDTARKPRLGFVGVGWIGRNRLESVIQADVAEISAIHDAEPDLALQAQALSPEAEVSASFDELLRSDLDGLIIATPNRFHAEQAIAALKHDVAVFCQKPLGISATDTRMIVDCARAANRLLGVDLSYRAIPGIRIVCDLVRSGALGKIFAIDAKFHNGYGPGKRWFYDHSLAGGGCILDLGVHLLDLALEPMGYPRVARVQSSLFADGKRLSKRVPVVEDYGAATIETVEDSIINLSCCWNLPIGRGANIEISFYGTGGGASLRNIDGSFFDFIAERFNGTEKETLCVTQDAKPQWGGLATLQWIDSLSAKKGFDPAAERYVFLAEIIDRIYGR